MACEKLAKAYRLQSTAAELDGLLERHVGFVRFVRSYLRSNEMKVRYHGRHAQLLELCKLCTQIAGEIEKLAPAVDRSARPENAEYPWPDGDRVVVPADYTYPNLTLLQAPGGRAFLRMIEGAMREL
jgi:hypothetical protein